MHEKLRKKVDKINLDVVSYDIVVYPSDDKELKLIQYSSQEIGNYNHTADYDGVAYFNNEDFNRMKQIHFKNRDFLDKIKVSKCNGYLIPFRKAIEEQQISFEDELFHDIVKNDIYELPIEIHTKLILDKWNDFVNNYIEEDKVIIFECCLIQNPVTVSMVKNNSPKDDTMSYINSLAKTIVPLDPIIIYVEQEDIKASFNKVVCERPKEWFEGFKDYYTKQGYGLSNNLKDLDGVIQVLEARNRLEHDVYDSLHLFKYKIDNSAFNLDFLKEKSKCIIENHL
ncbi:MAG: hypothetical protein ACERKV_06880 [Clostridiaceae bacterium]